MYVCTCDKVCMFVCVCVQVRDDHRTDYDDERGGFGGKASHKDIS